MYNNRFSFQYNNIPSIRLYLQLEDLQDKKSSKISVMYMKKNARTIH